LHDLQLCTGRSKQRRIGVTKSMPADSLCYAQSSRNRNDMVPHDLLGQERSATMVDRIREYPAPRSFQRNFLSSKNHITSLLSPAHTPGGRIWPMRWSYSARDFVVQDGAQDLHSGLPGHLFYLRLHLGSHLGHRQRHPHQQLLPSHDLELVIGLALFPLVILSHGGSLL
jgi:hypothetical protein